MLLQILRVVRESLPTPDTDDVAVAPGDALPLPAAPKRPKPAPAPAPARQLSDYELLRERKVAANRAKLEALGFGAPAAAPKKPPKKKYKKHVFRDDSEFAAPPRRSAREAAVASRSPGAFRDGGLGTLEERRAAREAKARARADRERARDLAKARKDRAEVAKCLRALVRDDGKASETLPADERLEVVNVDLADVQAAEEACSGASYIIWCAQGDGRAAGAPAQDLPVLKLARHPCGNFVVQALFGAVGSVPALRGLMGQIMPEFQSLSLELYVA